MKNAQEKMKLTIAVNAMKAAGYNPYAQLTGYLTTGNAAYITRRGGARRIVCALDRNVIGRYLAG